MYTTLPASNTATSAATGHRHLAFAASFSVTAPHARKCTGYKITKYVRYVHKPVNVNTSTGTTAHDNRIHVARLLSCSTLKPRTPFTAATSAHTNAATHATRCPSNSQSPTVSDSSKYFRPPPLFAHTFAGSNSRLAAIPSTSSIRPAFMI